MYPYVLFGGFAVLSLVSGAYHAALASVSRSRLGELVAGRGDRANGFLREILEGQAAPVSTTALLHSLCSGAFFFTGILVWVRPYFPEAGGRWGGPAVAALAGLFLLHGFLRLVGSLLVGMDEEKAVLLGARPMGVLTLPLRMPVAAVLAGARIVARGLGRDAEKTEEEREEEVMAAVSDGELDGIVAEEQREMIENVFDFKTADVADIMTPRTEMEAIGVDAPLSEAIALALEKGHSRIPVHGETRDDMVGLFYVRDALAHWGVAADGAPPLRDLLRKPLFVPETKNVQELLAEMRREKLHFAIVLDEYGGTAGVVTIEDVLEEIVGEIQDEFDNEDDAPAIRPAGPDTIVAEAHVHVTDINEALDLDVIPEDDDFETLGGFVLDNLGHIPKPGESFTFGRLRLKVLTADERRVKRVQIRRLTEAEEVEA